MDKYEYKVRADEIRELISQGAYAQAAEIADTIDWRRVKSVMMLCTISDLYKINRRYEDARDMLLLAYERRPGGRTICYSLCELSIKMEEYVQAIEYYKEFVQVASKDPGRYILQYKLYEAQDVSLEERIQVLEELKKRDYREKWAYELAYLYHRVGLSTQCVDECDELILWFGEGKYVIKAMELKMLHQPLSEEQQYRYDHRFDAVPAEEETYQEQPVSEGEQEAYYAAPEGETFYQEPADSEGNGYGDAAYEGAAYGEAGYGEADPEQTEAQPENYEVYYEDQQSQDSMSDTRVFEPVREPMETQDEEDELDIHVKTMDVGEYNTINLQAELAEGLKEVLASETTPQAEKDRITRAIMEPMMESDTESLDDPMIEEIDDEDLEDAPEEMESTEVFFGETGEISTYQQQTVPDITGELVLEQMRQEVNDTPREPSRAEEVLKAEPPKGMAEVLSQEPDGQISLVVPENNGVEKQITGQMNIEDILAEWERMKKENEEKRKEEVRLHVLRQTGSLFNEFEESVRDGLLEKLESGEVAQEELDAAASAALNGGVAESTEEHPEGTENAEAYEDTESTEEAGDEDFQELEEEPVDYGEEYPEGTENAEVYEDTEAYEDAETTEEAGDEDFQELEEEPVDYDEENPETVENIEETESTEEAEDEDFQEMEEEPVNYDEENPEVVEDAENKEVVEEPETTEESEAVEEPETTEESEATEEPEVTEEPEAAEASEDTQPTEAKTVTKTPQVEQDKPKTRPLTREEKELYAPFIQSRAAREQLVKAIDLISMAAYTGNLIVTGEEGMDTLTLAKNIIREIQMMDSNFSGKVAKITGIALNSKDPAKITDQLKNGALIIEKAAAMEAETVQKLYKSLQQESLGIVVVLEDTKKSMNKLLKTYPELAESFNARIDVEALSNDTLVAFGKHYAKGLEYSIDDLGVLALHTRIQEMQTIDHVVTILEVKEIVDEAIRHANRKTIGHFLDILFARRYDDEDMIILTEKDFA